ncbi:MAG: MC/SLC25 family protein [Pseudomonadota bacterium]
MLLLPYAVFAAAEHELTRQERALAAATACITGAVTTLPIDVIKTRIQTLPPRTSVGRVAASILSQDGPRGFFRGLAPALLMTPGSILQYTLYDELRKSLPPLPAATLAGIVDITVRTPFEKLKTVAQAGVFPQGHLWSGYGATLLRDVPYVCIYWSAYDLLKRIPHDNTAVHGFVAGFCAGAIAASACTPFDVVKTRIQTAPPGLAPFGVFANLIRTQGITYLFAGLPARLVRIPVYTGVVLATFETAKFYFAK